MRTCPHLPDLRALSPAPRPADSLPAPDPQEDPQTANPAPAPGLPAWLLPGILTHQDHLPKQSQLTALFAESGQPAHRLVPPCRLRGSDSTFTLQGAGHLPMREAGTRVPTRSICSQNLVIRANGRGGSEA